MAVYIKYETQNIEQLIKGLFSFHVVFSELKGVTWQ